MLRAYPSLGISQPEWGHRRATWASSRPEVSERCPKGAPKTPQESPKSGPRRSAGCSSWHFKNHRIPLVFIHFLRYRGVLRASCGAPGVLLGGLRAGSGGHASFLGARERPNASQDALGTPQNRPRRPQICAQEPFQGLERASSKHLKTLQEQPKTFQHRKVITEAPQECPRAEKGP